MERSSGILLHITSLPAKHGIGTLGREAYAFADFLASAGQRYWQVLPLGQTGYGDSPYQSFSTHAGNPYLIDLDLLLEEGLLQAADLSGIDWGQDPRYVDYGAVFQSRYKVLYKAFLRAGDRFAQGMDSFIDAEPWVWDYALFMALKKHFQLAPWLDWPDASIRTRQPEAMERYGALLKDDIRFYVFLQLLFFRQWDALKGHLAARGIKLIGDLPIYVAMDSADVWACRDLFQLDAQGYPLGVAGVPPDYFSATGQLWGNPLYDWPHMASDDYSWWLERLEAASRLYDVIRIDHFRGFESYWEVPWGAETAAHGRWCKGPGMDFFQAVNRRFPNLPIIAEDLGFLTDDVRKMVADCGYPGMKVLQFAFNAREPSVYLPHAYSSHCVCYTGTHDNTTLAGWFHAADPADVAFAAKYLGLNEKEGPCWGMIRGGMGSVAALFVAQMQDYLELGAECRMNIPGTVGNNWRWRLLPGEYTDELAGKIAAYTRMYGRHSREQR